METITMCENVCRDFHWLPVVAQVMGGLATVGTMMIAWFAYRNWRGSALAQVTSTSASELSGKLREFFLLIISARRRPNNLNDFDYARSAEIMAQAHQVWREMLAESERLDALLNSKDISRSVEDLLYLYDKIYLELETARRRDGELTTVNMRKRFGIWYVSSEKNPSMMSKGRTIAY
jgi:hypothetical protein